MEPVTVQLSSITVAMRGKKILERHGIRSYMTRTQEKNQIGCGYSLLVYGSLEQVKDLLIAAGVTIRGIKRGDSLL